MSPYLILGVDPGLTGSMMVLDPLAIANRPNGTIVAQMDMPKIKRGSRSELDHSKLACFIDSMAHKIKYAVIEDVAAAPNQGVVSMFTFGKVTGVVIGVIAAHHIPIYFIKPSVWKHTLGLSSSKELSIGKARHLWPAAAHLFARKSDDGRAEAALIAHFGKRFYNV